MTKAVWGEFGSPGTCPRCGASGTYGAEFNDWIYPKSRPFRETNVRGWWENKKNWQCWSCSDVMEVS